MAPMRKAVLALLVLAACSDRPETLEIVIPTVPDGHLRMPDSPALRRWQYRLEAKSTVRRPVDLEARFEGPVPEGLVVRLAGDTRIPREGSAWPHLIVIVPEKEVSFSGAVVIESPDLAGWSTRFTFEGNVALGPREGRYLRARPPGLDLGKVRPGDEKQFAFALESYGSQPVNIREWMAEDPERVKLPPSTAVSVTSGGEHQLTGVLLVPRVAGRFETRIRVTTDAQNFRGAMELRLAGEVEPDYAPNPPRLLEPTAYPVLQPEFSVDIRAREGVAPFTVESVAGHERYFEVVSLGGKEPARHQLVKLKLRRDAPTDANRDAEFSVRFRLEPTGEEVPWGVRIRLNPPLHAAPGELHFGTVSRSMPEEAEIRLTALPGRKFRVVRAQSEQGLVRVRVPEEPSALGWRVLVSLPGGLAPGILQDRVVIETDDPYVPRLIVPVRAIVR